MKKLIMKKVLAIAAMFGIAFGVQASSDAMLRLTLDSANVFWDGIRNDSLKVDGVGFEDYGMTNEILSAGSTVSFEYDEVDGFYNYVDGQSGTLSGTWYVAGTHHAFTCSVPVSLTTLWTCDLSVSASRQPGTLAGSGSWEDPYQLASVDDLWTWSTNGTKYASNACYEVVSDIDINAETAATLLPLFPTDGNKFAGVIYGNFHKITYELAATNKIGGLFGYAQSALFYDMVVDGTVTVSETNNNAAILVVEASGDMLFENVTTEGAISGSTLKNAAGVCMHYKSADGISNALEFNNCVNKASITSAYTKFGGMIAYTESGTSEGYNVVLNGCRNEGAITCTGSDNGAWVGGMGGWLSYGSFFAVTNCSNTGALTAIASVCKEKNASVRVGGMFATIGKPFALKGCSNSGTITGVGQSVSGTPANGGIGGLVGVAEYNNFTIADCSNTGIVQYGDGEETVDISAFTKIGSLVGYNTNIISRDGKVTAQDSIVPLGKLFCSDFAFATVNGGVATFCDPEVGGSYKVMLGGATFELAAAGDTITLDETLTNATVTLASALSGTYKLVHDGDVYSVMLAVPATIEVSEVTGASTVNVYSNGTELTATPYVVDAGTEVSITWTVDDGYSFPDGSATFTTNFTANAASITVALAEDRLPIEAVDCFTVDGIKGQSFTSFTNAAAHAPDNFVIRVHGTAVLDANVTVDKSGTIAMADNGVALTAGDKTIAVAGSGNKLTISGVTFTDVAGMFKVQALEGARLEWLNGVCGESMQVDLVDATSSVLIKGVKFDSNLTGTDFLIKLYNGIKGKLLGKIVIEENQFYVRKLTGQKGGVFYTCIAKDAVFRNNTIYGASASSYRGLLQICNESAGEYIQRVVIAGNKVLPLEGYEYLEGQSFVAMYNNLRAVDTVVVQSNDLSGASIAYAVAYGSGSAPSLYYQGNKFAVGTSTTQGRFKSDGTLIDNPDVSGANIADIDVAGWDDATPLYDVAEAAYAADFTGLEKDDVVYLKPGCTMPSTGLAAGVKVEADASVGAFTNQYVLVELIPIPAPAEDTPEAVSNALAEVGIPASNAIYGVVTSAADIAALNELLKANGKYEVTNDLSEVQLDNLSDSFVVKSTAVLSGTDVDHLFANAADVELTGFAASGANWAMTVKVVDGETALKIAAAKLAEKVQKCTELPKWGAVDAKDISVTSGDGTDTVVLTIAPPGTANGFLRVNITK